MTGVITIAFTRRAILVAGSATLGALGARHIGGDGPSLDGVDVIVPKGGENTLNDASRLSETPIHKHIVLHEDPGDALLTALRRELAAAKAENRPVNVSAARHSMGGQSIPSGGHAITFDSTYVETADGHYRVQAGARWRDVIAKLAAVSLSPKVMQANNDFGIGATFSVNAHGWATAHGPMGSTVKSIKILLADGSHITASRTENDQIFAAAMGGYGLIGLITELEIEALPNAFYEPAFEHIEAEAFAPRFQDAVRKFPMVYGRMNIDRESFFSEALMVTYRPVDGEIPPLESSGSAMTSMMRRIFRAQTSNEWVKRRRWGLETSVGTWFSGPVSRAKLFNDPVSAVLRQTDLRRTDIIHEYFVAPEQFPQFLDICRQIIPGSYQELLNVTLRWVEQDPLSVLSYAPKGPRLAAVLSFSQEMTARADADMKRMTQRLIAAVRNIGGTYYLPYRPHATVAQFTDCYDRAAEFAALKRQLDPQLVFRNALWDTHVSQV